MGLPAQGAVHYGGVPARRRGAGELPGDVSIGTDFFPDKSALAEAVAVYERASERVWPRSRDQILSFFDGFELLEPGLVPKLASARSARA